MDDEQISVSSFYPTLKSCFFPREKDKVVRDLIKRRVVDDHFQSGETAGPDFTVVVSKCIKFRSVVTKAFTYNPSLRSKVFIFVS